ncbi:MAG: hypothetical protein Q9218_002185 [Villophora microphyllina]
MTQLPSVPMSGYQPSAGHTQETEPEAEVPPQGSVPKKSRTNTPWTQAEEQRLKTMREAGNSWSEIAKTFPNRTEGSVKKHWYKDMHYADFAEDEVRQHQSHLHCIMLRPRQSAALLAAIKEYESSKWKVIGAKVGKPAKVGSQSTSTLTKLTIAGV